MEKSHFYEAAIEWTGNQGSGTSTYKAYTRDHNILIDGKPVIAGSADAAFLGNAARHNPEDLLVASLSACHMLWYLHLCSTSGIKVMAYKDNAIGQMVMNEDGSGQFSSVTLRPHVRIGEGGDVERATSLHSAAFEKCFIARSVNFPVHHDPMITIG
jgi:organic hydroperoxide reductase OsmC/OhrA